LAIAIALAAIMLWLAVRGVAWRDIVADVRRATPKPLLFALGVLSVSYLVRGLRWAILLRAASAISTAVVIWATMIGYLANNFLPARVGEPIRSVVISRHSAISVSAALGTALTERIIDAAVLAVVGITSLVFVPGLPSWVRTGAWTMAAAALLALLGVLAAPRFADELTGAVHRLPLRPHWSTRLADWLKQFLGGLQALRDVARAVRFLALTAVVWCLDATAARLAAHAVNLKLDFAEALVLLSALGLSTAAPSTPGYVGIYQFVSVSVLAAFGVARSEALVFIVAFQAVVYAVITVGGLAGLWRLRHRKELPTSGGQR
jgi:uncharacterized protein (TIRG00374 family)